MKKRLFICLCPVLLQACITMPVRDKEAVSRCEISTDRKTLKIIDLAKETNSFYSISGLALSPILIPTTAIISGSYVLVNNTYRLGEETIKCETGSIPGN